MIGHVTDGKLIFENIDLFRKHLQELEGKNVEFVLKKLSSSKTVNQLAYYRGHLVPQIAKCMGEYDEEYVHYELKRKFLTKYVGDVDVTRNYIRDLSSLNKDETSTYIEKVYYFAVELGADVHPADRYWKGNNNE